MGSKEMILYTKYEEEKAGQAMSTGWRHVAAEIKLVNVTSLNKPPVSHPQLSDFTTWGGSVARGFVKEL